MSHPDSPTDRVDLTAEEAESPQSYEASQGQPALFDAIAPIYDSWFGSPLGRLCFRWEREAVMAAAQPAPGMRVLDVGCGTGIFTVEIARAGADVVGLDISPQMLDRARLRAGGNHLPIDFRLGKAERLPFPNSSFDLAISVTMLEFVEQPQMAVAEMARVVKPGGRLVIAVLSSQSLWALQRRLSRDETIYTQAHFFSPSEMVRLLKTYGRVEWKGCVMVPPWYAASFESLYEAWEALGQKLWGRFGAFLVAQVQLDKPLVDTDSQGTHGG